MIRFVGRCTNKVDESVNICYESGLNISFLGFGNGYELQVVVEKVTVSTKKLSSRHHQNSGKSQVKSRLRSATSEDIC